VCTVRQLLPGCTYRMRVAAHNAAGQGAFSYPADVSTAATSPNPPTDLQVVSRCAVEVFMSVQVVVEQASLSHRIWDALIQYAAQQLARLVCCRSVTFM
jgi:hypothetical protein